MNTFFHKLLEFETSYGFKLKDVLAVVKDEYPNDRMIILEYIKFRRGKV
jgi:hypothetical protein